MDYVSIRGLSAEASTLGFGCWGIGGHGYGPVDDMESVRCLRLARELGITLFDTADVYGFGHSERMLRRAFGSALADLVVVTKFGVRWDESGRTWKDSSAVYARQAVDASLRRLGLECLPILLIHWLDGTTPLDETLDALVQLRKDGKIRAFGLSNVTGRVLHGGLESYDLALVQMEFGIANQRNVDAMRKCREHGGPAVVAFGSLSRGLMSGEYRVDTHFEKGDTRATDSTFKGERLARRLTLVEHLERVGGKYQRQPVEVALRWALDAPEAPAVIVGMTQEEQVRANAAVCEWRLSEDDWLELSRISGELFRGEQAPVPPPV